MKKPKTKSYPGFSTALPSLKKQGLRRRQSCSQGAYRHGSLNPEIVKKVKRLRIRANYLVDELFAGEYKSAFRGRGMEFEEVRPYQSGDDVRTINWNITARYGLPYVKVFREERQITVMLIVDVSPSTHFGSAHRTKQDLSAEISATLACAALKNNDNVGLILFSDRIEGHIPPRKGQRHLWKLMGTLLGCSAGDRKTDIRAPLDFLMKTYRRRTVCFVISDFIDQGFEKSLSAVSRKHDLTALLVEDRREAALPPMGLLALKDAESGQIVWVDSGKADFQEQFTAQAKLAQKERIRGLMAAGAHVVAFDTAKPVVTPLVRYFRLREKRQAQ